MKLFRIGFWTLVFSSVLSALASMTFVAAVLLAKFKKPEPLPEKHPIGFIPPQDT